MQQARRVAATGAVRNLGAVLATAAVLVAAIAGLARGSALANGNSSAPANSSDGAAARIATLDRQLDVLARYAGSSRAPASVRARIGQVAAERMSALSDLAQRSPAIAQSLELQPDVRDRIDAVAPGLVETPVKLTGSYTVVATNHADGSTGYARFLQVGSTTYTLVSAATFPPLVSGSLVSADGMAIGNTVLLEASGSTSQADLVATGSASIGAGMVGVTNVAVILGTFTDTTSAPTVAAEQAAFSGYGGGNDVDSWYAQASYGKTSVAPTFFGPFQLNETTASGCANTSTLAQGIVQMSSSALTFANYSRLMFVVACPNIAGVATVGLTSVPTPQGTITAGESWIGPSAWTDLHTLVHELGHNAGMFHADWAICEPDTFDPPTRFGPNCVPAPYGDPFDVMGAPTATVSHFDAYHTAVAGWFSAANYPAVSVTGTSTYTIAPIETASPGVMALNIPRGNSGTSWTVEYRQPLGPDAWMSACDLTSGCNVTAGASIKVNGNVPGSSEDTHAIDMTPGSQPLGATYWPTQDLEADGVLLPGKTFTDSEFGIVISAVSADAAGLTVQVTLPAQSCTRAPATVAMPSHAFTVAPGASLATTLSVTNNDSPGCPGERFEYAGTGYADPGLVTLSPGATASLAVTYTPPSEGYAYYVFNPEIVPDSLSEPPVAWQATLQVAGPADANSPTTPTSISAEVWGSATVALHWAASSDAVAVAYYDVYRDGALIGTSVAPTYVDTSASGTSHTYTIGAVNEAHVESPLSVAASVSIPAATDITAPSSPANVRASAVSDHSITVNWNASSDNTGVAYYEVYGGPDGVETVDATKSSATVSDMQSSSPFTLYVIAYDGAGNASSYATSYANAVKPSTAVSGTAAPQTPSALMLTAFDQRHASLSWQPVADAAGVTGYVVIRNSVRLATVTGTTYTDASINGCGNCQYSVEAVDAAGNTSAATAPVNDNGGSASPPSVSITAPSGGSSLTQATLVTVSAGAASGVASVSVYVDLQLAATSTIAPFTTSLDPQWLASGAHSLVAVARDNSGDLASSTPVSITVSVADTTPPTAPALVLGYPASATEVDLEWAPGTDNIGVASYEVLRNGSVIATVDGTSFADETAPAGSASSYQVVARDAAGNASAATPQLVVTTFAQTLGPAPTPTPTPPPPPSPTPSATPAPSPGAISGTVLNPHGPVSGATVSVNSAGVAFTTTTSRTGTFAVNGLPANTYSVTASSKFSSSTVTVTVQAGTTTTATITLRK